MEGRRLLLANGSPVSDRITQAMFTSTVLPRFEEFCTSQIFSRAYDYVVPLESKGIILVNQAMRYQPHWTRTIRYLRAFDFIDPSEMSGKRIACVDDTVVFGRTLERARQRLLSRGAGQVDKFACMHRIDPYDYDRSGTVDVFSCIKINLLEYDIMGAELSALTFGSRPSFPDHLTYAVYLNRPLPARSLSLTLHDRGFVCTHARPGYCTDYSLHYPDFCPQLPAGARDTGPNKLRFRLSDDEMVLYVVPAFFPAANHMGLTRRAS
jgi:hypothetical protein